MDNYDNDRPAMSVGDADNALFGAMAGREERLPQLLEIINIRPDIRQPRQVIPPEVRQALPVAASVFQLLEQWHTMAEEQYGQPIDTMHGLMAYGEGHADDFATGRILGGWFKLMSLASTIQRDGQINPITVWAERFGDFIIETGERRWLAHCLLWSHKFEKYAVISARVVSRLDPWRQAAENGRREPLNAIGKARQLAILIMDLLEGRDIDFYSIDAPFFEGQIDRHFYAQVANGNIHKIPRKQGRRLLDATGITSMPALRKYRALLSISDETWLAADANDWSEGYIRMLTNEPQAQTASAAQDISLASGVPYDSAVDALETAAASFPTDDRMDEVEEVMDKADSERKSAEIEAQGGDEQEIDQFAEIMKLIQAGIDFLRIGQTLEVGDSAMPDHLTGVWFSFAETIAERICKRPGIDALVDYTDRTLSITLSAVADEPVADSQLILGAYPPSLEMMMNHLQASAVDCGNNALSYKLQWLLAMTREDIAAVFVPGSSAGFSEWLGKAGLDIDALLSSIVTEFREQMGAYLAELREVGDEIVAASDDT